MSNKKPQPGGISEVIRGNPIDWRTQTPKHIVRGHVNAGGTDARHHPKCLCNVCARTRLRVAMESQPKKFVCLFHAVAHDGICYLCDPPNASRETQIAFDKLFESRTFDEAMAEIHSLRAARLQSHWKLFRLALCQSAIRELKIHG